MYSDSEECSLGVHQAILIVLERYLWHFISCLSVEETVIMDVYDLLGMQNKSYFYYFVVVTSHDFVFVVKGAEGRPVRKIIL